MLAFDIWGDYAHFRRVETTTSPLTYSIPTGTSLAGLISAIIGLDKSTYLEHFSPESTRFAIRILNPVKKITMTISLVNTKMGFYLWDIKENPRTLIPFEFLKDPKYRVYFWTDSRELYQSLRARLERHHSFYTPYMGIANLVAEFRLASESQVKEPRMADESVEIHSAIRKDETKLMAEEGKRYARERIPLYMDKNRVVEEYADVFFEMNCQPVRTTKSEYYVVGNENVVFL